MEEGIERRKDEITNLFRKRFFSWVQDNYDRIFILILIVAFIIRFWIFMRTLNQPLWWDEATYLATAKRWGLGLNITDVWYYRRAFFWPAFCAVFFKLGIGEIGIRFSEVIFSTGIVAVSYFLIRDMFDKKSALLTSLGLTFSWVILFFTARPMTEIPSAFFLLLSLLFFWKGYSLNKGKKLIYLCAIFYAIAVLIRFQHMMFIIPILVFIFVRDGFKMLRNKKLWIALLIFLLLLVPYFVLYSLHYGFFLTDITKHYFGIGVVNPEASAVLSKNFLNYFDYFMDFPYLLTKFLLIFLLIGSFYFFIDMFLGIDKILKNERIQKIFFVFIVIVIPLLVLGYISGLVEQRYALPVLPFLFLMISAGLVKIGEFASKFLKLNNRFVFVLIFLVLAGFMIPNFIWGTELIDAKKTSYIEIQQASLWIKENSNSTDMVIASSYPQVSYYSERAINVFTARGNPEEKKTISREEFEEFVKTEKPRYLITYAFQPHPDWVGDYLNKTREWIPVRVYYMEQNPVLVIYEFKG